METYVIGEEINYSDFIKELMALDVLSNKGEEVFPDKEHKEVTIDDFWFLGV